MDRLLDARLHVVVALGIPAIGWLFSRCWNYDGSNFYSPPSGYPFCVELADVSAFGIVPLKWLIAGSICVVLFSIYRIWSGNNSN